MSIKDERALLASEMQPENARGAPSSDIDRVLQLIAAQIDDADRRQAQVLGQLAERLERLEGAAKSARDDYALDSNAAGNDVADTELKSDLAMDDRASNSVIPEWSADEDEAHEFVEALFERKSLNAHAGATTEPANTLEKDVWADNAADLDYGTEHDADAFDFRADTGDVADLPRAEHAFTPTNNLNSAISSLRKAASREAIEINRESSYSDDYNRPSVADEVTQEIPAASLSGNADDPWSNDDAERLMQVYDQDVFGKSGAAQPSHIEYDAEATSIDEPVEPQLNTRASFDNQWLESKFSEIAIRVEQTLEEMRATDPVSGLREHFAQFQQDMANAVGDMPTRNDIEGLKVVEGELEELREHFAHVQDQLSRLDSVEKQLEAVIDRLSDDRLMTLLSGSGGGAQPDHAEFAAIVGEYVVNRVADRQPQAAQSEGKLDSLEEMLTNFIEEQRTGADYQSGVLNTLQDAMVQVLDKVESQAASPAAGYASESLNDIDNTSHEFASDAAHEEYARDEDFADFGAADELAEEALDPSSYGLDAQDLRHVPANEIFAEDAYDAAFEAEQINATAVDAADEVSSRHPDFEPFSDDAGSSVSQPPNVEVVLPQVMSAAVPTMQQPHAGELSLEQPHEPVSQGAPVPSGDSVARLRQEFINEARRAKEQADAERAANGGMEVEPEKKDGFTLFGISLGGKRAPKANAPSTSPATPTPRAAPAATSDHDFALAHTHTEEPKIAGMSRKKVLLGAFVLMIAASGVLLLMPRGEKPVSPTPTIEQVPQPLEQPEMIAPKPVAAPAPSKADVSVPMPPAVPAQVREPAPAPIAPTGSKPADAKFDKDSDIDIKSGDRSDIGDAWSRRTGSLVVPSHPTQIDLAGVTLQTPLKPATPEALAHMSNQQSMAHWSLKLGDAASRARTSDLLPEYQQIADASAQPAPVSKAALEVPREVSVEKPSSSRTQLALPPATVGPLSLRVAAANGDPSAEFEVAARLAGGKGTTQDFKKAMKWYSRSASRGFAQSQYRLGTLYERGLGINKDVERARIWYQRAAEQGNIKAMHNLAVLSASATNGAPDYATASKWFAKAANFGLSDSQFNLAVLHENGLGVEHDLKRAYELYALAAMSGDTDSAKRRDSLKKQLSDEDRAVADGYIANWRSERGPKLANDPIYAGQAWKKRASSDYMR